jgi:hypothetical protein
VLWQWFAPDLWRRFTIAHRTLAHQLCIPAHALSEVATVQYATVASSNAAALFTSTPYSARWPPHRGRGHGSAQRGDG